MGGDGGPKVGRCVRILFLYEVQLISLYHWSEIREIIVEKEAQKYQHISQILRHITLK